MHLLARTLLAAAVAAAGTGLASAQPVPIKPGLWQVHLEHDGQDMSAQMREMQEQLKEMPPEQRKQVEAMMKRRGMGAGRPGDVKVCLTKEQLDRGAWEGQHERCKTTTTRSGNTWKFHSSCPAPDASETDGEAVFASAESYTVNSTTREGTGADATTHKATMTSKWLGADCGEIRPARRPGARPQK